jgi:hypothetical protein
VSYGHGRIEHRRLWALPLYDDYLDWPGARLMLRLERQVIVKRTGEVRREVSYALSSFDLEQASAAQLLTWWRQHWHIENKLHYVRDVTLGEDACRARCGNSPQVLAAIRNIVLAVLRRHGFANIAEALRCLAQNPYRALGLLITL